MGARLGAASVAIFLQLPSEPAHAAQRDASPWSGYLQVYGERYFWRFGLVSLTVQSSFIAFQGLWIGPWMRRVLGMDAASTAQALFAFNLGLFKRAHPALGILVCRAGGDRHLAQIDRVNGPLGRVYGFVPFVMGHAKAKRHALQVAALDQRGNVAAIGGVGQVDFHRQAAIIFKQAQRPR